MSIIGLKERPDIADDIQVKGIYKQFGEENTAYPRAVSAS